MKLEKKNSSLTDIPKQAFEQFLKELSKKEGVSSNMIENLKKTIIEKDNISEDAIKNALFSEDNEIL